MSRKRVYIFDFDGCLIDSEYVQKSAYEKSYSIVVGDSNCPSFDEFMKYTGSSIDNTISRLYLPKEMAEKYREICIGMTADIVVNWEAIEYIKKLRERELCKVALCTGKDRNRTTKILNYFNIQEIFDILVCGDDGIRNKPEPDSINEILKELGICAEEAVMIGDGAYDVMAAKAAGITSILTKWYSRKKVNLEERADYEVNSVKELITIFETM